jgi:hypothetical protein
MLRVLSCGTPNRSNAGTKVIPRLRYRTDGLGGCAGARGVSANIAGILEAGALLTIKEPDYQSEVMAGVELRGGISRGTR